MNIDVKRIFMCHVGVDRKHTILTRVASPIIGEQGGSPPITGEFDFVPVYEEFSGDMYPECGRFKSYKELKLRTTDIRDIVRALVEDQLLVFEIVWKSLDENTQNRLSNLLPIEIQLLSNNDVNRLVDFYLSTCVHYDPEFEHFTYGDYPQKCRASLLWSIGRGDLLFFNSRLQLWDLDDKKFYVKKPKNISREQFIHERVKKSLEYRKRMIKRCIKKLMVKSKFKEQEDEYEQGDGEICLRAALYNLEVPKDCQEKYLYECRKKACMDFSLYVYDWYIIGYFQIEDIVKLDEVTFDEITNDERLKLSPHYQRYIDTIAGAPEFDNAWIFIGSAERSLLFKKAIIIVNDLWKELSEYVISPYCCKSTKYCGLRGCVVIYGDGVKIFLNYIKEHVPEFQSLVS